MKTATKQTKEEFSGITVTVLELKQSVNALNQLFNFRFEKNLAWRWRLVFRQVDKALKETDTKLLAIQEQFKTADADGVVKFDDENLNKAMEEFGKEVCELAFKPMKLSDLGKFEPTPIELSQLEWLFEAND